MNCLWEGKPYYTRVKCLIGLFISQRIPQPSAGLIEYINLLNTSFYEKISERGVLVEDENGILTKAILPITEPSIMQSIERPPHSLANRELCNLSRSFIRSHDLILMIDL